MRSGWWVGSWFLIGLSLLSAGEARAGGNLLVNGGFEAGNLSGWSVSGNTRFTMVTDYSVGLPGIGPDATYSGSHYALLGPVGSMGHLSQTIATTAGQTYFVSWWLASDSNAGNEFSASWNGATLFDQVDVPREGYQFFTERAVATGSSSTLAFSYRNDPGFFSLDNVSVLVSPTVASNRNAAVVPEPAGLLLLGLGLTATIGAGRSGIALTRTVRLR